MQESHQKFNAAAKTSSPDVGYELAMEELLKADLHFQGAGQNGAAGRSHSNGLNTGGKRTMWLICPPRSQVVLHNFIKPSDESWSEGQQ